MIREMGMRMLIPEIHDIKDKDIQNFVRKALNELVDEKFFIIPASSTGKYHPTYSAGVGGLLRHTKAACYIGKALCEAEMICQEDKDLIQAALILHDINKPAKEHPYLVRETLSPLKEEFPSTYEKVIELIESHHGQWGEYPINTYQKRIVHLADYISSQKGLIFSYDQGTDYSDLLWEEK